MPNTQYNRLDDNGLLYLLTLLKDEIAQSGEENVIETVKVNGTALTPDANKAVDVTVPTKTSDLTNDGDGSDSNSPFATQAYVAANGGKIDKIKVNGTEQTITNKEVDLTVPEITVSGYTASVEIKTDETVTFTSSTNGVTYDVGLTNKELVDKTYVDGAFRTEAQVQTAIDNAIAGITGIEYQVVQSLPQTGEKGVIYLVSNSGTAPNVYDEYIWIDGDPSGSFEKIGTTSVDLSGYVQASEMHALTNTEIDNIFNQVFNPTP